MHLPSLYAQRLQRDGWSLVSSTQEGDERLVRYEKHASKEWTLRKIAVDGTRPNRAMESEYHELVSRLDGTVKSKPDWEWSEVDGESVVWALGGCLYRARVDPKGETIRPQMLHDFNNYEFDERIAPY